MFTTIVRAMRTGAYTLLLALGLAATAAIPANATEAPTIGDNCASVGTTAIGSRPLTCVDIGRDRYVWARITPSAAATNPDCSCGWGMRVVRVRGKALLGWEDVTV